MGGRFAHDSFRRETFLIGTTGTLFFARRLALAYSGAGVYSNLWRFFPWM